MSAPKTNPVTAPLTESQRTALISLLGDEDSSIYYTVRERLLACGPEAVTWLRPSMLSNDPLVRQRSREIVQTFGRQDADSAFLLFCLRQGEDFDLEEGVWLLAATEYPDLNEDAYRAVLDGFATDLRIRLDFTASAQKLLGGMNDYLFREKGFTGNEQDYYAPENSYLNSVIDRRTGNPISLATLYILIGRRLRLPVTGIGLPGHFLCRLQTTLAELYVDAFNRGRLLTKVDCIQHLVQTGHSPNDGFLTPASPRRILMRMCSNLHQIYQQADRVEETKRMQRYLLALAK